MIRISMHAPRHIDRQAGFDYSRNAKPRSFNPHSLRGKGVKPFIVWSRDDQFRAITDHQFALIRETYAYDDAQTPNRVIAVSVGPRYKSSDEIMGRITHLVFKGNRFGIRALEFIEQQDIYGFGHAWENNTLEGLRSSVKLLRATRKATIGH